jgi:hypothetical protein
MKTAFLSLALITFAVCFWIPAPSIDRADGVLAPSEPRQNPPGNTRPWERNGYRYTPLADFTIQARVLMAERYWFDKESAVSPLDLTLGWGPMSDGVVLRQFNIYRGSRCFYWKPRTPEAQALAGQAATHAANIHIIPATPELERDLKALRAGHLITMGGILVEVDRPDGWRWRSSLTREDSGPGACELMWVEWVRAS